MKKTLYIIALLFTSILLSSTSCEKDPYIQTKPVESAIYNEIKAHREANGVTGNFVQQLILIQQAQIFSVGMAANQSVDTTGISARWDKAQEMMGGTSRGLIITSTNNPDPAQIMDAWAADSATNAILLDDFSQCGVGVEQGADGLSYITVMLMLVE